MQLSDVPSVQDDTNLFSPTESNVPSFQAHFSIPSPATKYPDNNRGKNRKKIFFFFLLSKKQEYSARHHHHHHLFFHGLYDINQH